MISGQKRRNRQGLLSSQQPLVYAAAAFAAGIVLGARGLHPSSWWIAGALVFTLSAVLLLRRRAAAALPCSLLVLVALGALNFQVRQQPAAGAADAARFSDASELTIIAHVTRDGVIRKANAGNDAREVLDLQAEQIQRDGVLTRTDFGLRLSVYQSGRSRADDAAEQNGQDSAPPLRVYLYGERLKVLTKLRLPRNFGNPGAFDFRGYLANQGVVALGSARAEAVEVLAGTSGTKLGRWRSRLRRSLLDKISAIWQPWAL